MSWRFFRQGIDAGWKRVTPFFITLTQTIFMPLSYKYLRHWFFHIYIFSHKVQTKSENEKGWRKKPLQIPNFFIMQNRIENIIRQKTRRSDEAITFINKYANLKHPLAELIYSDPALTSTSLGRTNAVSASLDSAAKRCSLFECCSCIGVGREHYLCYFVYIS